jgi:hypothetical protein
VLIQISWIAIPGGNSSALPEKIPLLHQVIPVIDILTRHLEDTSSNSKYLPTICAGAAKGLVVLNKYYSKTNESIMYRCAMSIFCYCFRFCMSSNLNFIVLHPMYKLTYLRSKKWPEKWVDAARLVLQEQWTTYYKPSNSEEPGSQSLASNSELVSFDTHLF